MLRRRTAATLADYSLVALWAGLLFAVTRLTDSFPDSRVVGQLIAVSALTIPATVVLALSEWRGGSPGKRLCRLRVYPASPGRVFLRTALKVALPWELAHSAIWQLTVDAAGLGTGAMLVGAYALPIAALVSMARARPTWYDRLAGTTVCDLRDSVGSREGEGLP